MKKKSIMLLFCFALNPIVTYAVQTCEFNAFKIFTRDIATYSVSLTQAIDSVLENNVALQLQQYNPEIQKTSILQAKARFDNRINAYINTSERIFQSLSPAQTTSTAASHQSEASLGFGRDHYSGTRTSFDLTFSRNRTHTQDNFYATRIGARIDQPLQKGAGVDVNLVSLRQSELDLLWSEHELSGFVLNLIAQTERIYWQYYLALEELEIMRQSHRLAMQQQKDTIRRIEAGSIPESELAAAAAEVAMREEGVINAESNVVTTSIRLMRNINPDTQNYWRFRPELTATPTLPDSPPDDIDFHIDLALKLRPEIAQAKLMIERQELEIVQTKNGLLPRLDFFVTLGKTGYSTSFSSSNPRNVSDADYDISAGLVYELSRTRRSARALHQRALINRKMSEVALENLKQIIKEEVISSFVEANRAFRQIQATSATTRQQKEKLRIEEVKFSVGKSTSFQVAQAQRDYTAALMSEAKALVGYINAAIELFRADGTLLDRRNLIIHPTPTL